MLADLIHHNSSLAVGIVEMGVIRDVSEWYLEVTGQECAAPPAEMHLPA